jgi:ATP-dependent helicase/nuclease subunit B
MLHIATTAEERLTGAEVRACLEEALRTHGTATLLVSSFADQLVAQKELSAYPALSLGVTVTTPVAWTKERWEVWGDGTHVVEPLARTIAVQRAIAQAPQSLSRGVSLNAGTVQLLSSLVRGALPWLPLDPAGEPSELACHEAGLTNAEIGVVALAGEYARIIHQAGYVEESEAMARVTQAMAAGLVGPGPMCVTGLGEASRPTRELLADLACAGELTIVVQRGNDAALEGQCSSIALVEEGVASRGGSVSREGEATPGPVANADRAPELQNLVKSIFGTETGVAPTGAVELLAPAGPLAEAELVASRVVELAKSGAHEVVVVARGPARGGEGLPRVCKLCRAAL